jgi:hypothetical protein
MRGVDKIILRRKGGASKKQIKTSPNFETTRRHNAEFSGRAAASMWMMRVLFPLKKLADYNIAGPINALMKPVQVLDTESEFGKRHVQPSKNPGVLEGFSLNRKTIFESVISAPLSCVITKETLGAQVDIPALIPGINFRTPWKHPVYSVQAVLGIVPDLFYRQGVYKPMHNRYPGAEFAETPWFSCLTGSDPATLKLKLKTIPPAEAYTLMLSIGIAFGTITASGSIEQAKYAGCAKVVKLL